jgi:hypothetical protein
VIGGAQVDQDGNVNSTLVNGKLLVGSGGACDIALGAREVLVLARRERLVPRVQYITSPGERVRAVVVEDGVLERCSGGWTLHTLGLAPAPEHWELPTIPWSNLAPPTPGAGSPVPGSTIAQDRLSASLSTLELDFIEALRAEARAGTSAEHNVAERSDQTQGARCTA